MLPASRKIDSGLDLNDSKICVQDGTTTCSTSRITSAPTT